MKARLKYSNRAVTYSLEQSCLIFYSGFKWTPSPFFDNVDGGARKNVIMIDM